MAGDGEVTGDLVALLVFKTSVGLYKSQVGSIPIHLRWDRVPIRIGAMPHGHRRTHLPQPNPVPLGAKLIDPGLSASDFSTGDAKSLHTALPR
jgi:hypothetical protein